MVNATNTNPATLTQVDNPYVNPDGILGKDDFMKLMLIELQYQDPTEPMDTEKILSQTSQLATLESADNTNKALEELSKSLAQTQQFSVIGAIGKTASLGSDSLQHTQGDKDYFELYFPHEVEHGVINITDNDGNVIKTIDIADKQKGVYRFEWDGKNNNGALVDDGIYHISANYYDPNGDPYQSALGTYPIESVRFDNGKALLKLGSSYLPLEQVAEIF